MVTYRTRREAEEDGAVLTHTGTEERKKGNDRRSGEGVTHVLIGSCGLCSTTQDLAIYLSLNLSLSFRFERYSILSSLSCSV
jgi:hypothetical protein